MENIKASSLKTKEEVINDLNALLTLIKDGKEGYQSAEEATSNPELKVLFNKFSGERIVYASELKEHIDAHGGNADNQSGGITGGLHRTWLHIKELMTSSEDKSILSAITDGERSAIAKYDEYISDYADHADHLDLLKEHRDGIRQALNEIERRIVQAK